MSSTVSAPAWPIRTARHSCGPGQRDPAVRGGTRQPGRFGQLQDQRPPCASVRRTQPEQSALKYYSNAEQPQAFYARPAVFSRRTAVVVRLLRMKRAMLVAVFVLLTRRRARRNRSVSMRPRNMSRTRSGRPRRSAPALTGCPTGRPTSCSTEGTIRHVLAAGWQTVTYRQNTELHTEAWHWNPRGTWSEPGARGYFVGDAAIGKEKIIHSYGYPLPRRGVTRDDGTDMVGYSRLTDGDPRPSGRATPI